MRRRPEPYFAKPYFAKSLIPGERLPITAQTHKTPAYRVSALLTHLCYCDPGMQLDARHRLVGPRPQGALTVCESLGFCGVCRTPHATCTCASAPLAPPKQSIRSSSASNHINTMWTTFAVHVAVAAAVLPRVHLTPGTVVARESIRAAAFMTADDNGLSQIVAQVQSNMNEGELSTRGEGWFVAQAFLVLGVLFAPAEPVAPAAELTVGLTAIASGLALGAAAVRDLGVTNLTPWPKPVESNQLQIEGVYSLCRHPMYSCLLSASFGEPHVV